MNRSATDNEPTTATLRLEVNGVHRVVAVERCATLLEVLRESFELTGTKRGCDLGECGCCTVLLDGEPALACLTLALDAEGLEVTTIEGVSAPDGSLSAVQKAFVAHGAVQCGFCTPSMVLNATHLLANDPTPDLRAIKESVSGTICRCTGYTKIIRAIEAASTVGVER